MNPLGEIYLDDIVAARARLAGLVVRTPLLRLPLEGAPPEIWLKLENLQPIGSFKLRGASNAILRAERERLAAGVWTPSAGNMAQGVAWAARRLGVACTAVVPENAPRTKLDAVERYGGKLAPVPFDAWWRAMETGELPDAARSLAAGQALVHPFGDADVVAGNGTIGLEIIDELPDVDAVLVPFGGGGLITGIATAVHAVRPQARIFACEVESAAPLAAARAAGAPRLIEHRKSFVDGISGKTVMPAMWPHLQRHVEASLVVSLEQTCAAIRLLVERCRIVAEGAGAVAVAAALAGHAGSGRIACVVSGGNLDTATLRSILAGEIP